MRVTIASDTLTESGVSSKGKPYTERYQEAYLHQPGKPFPTSCRVALYDNARPFAMGDYESKQDLEISDFGRLQVKRDLVLSPAPAKA